MDKPLMEVITGFLSDTGFAQMSWQQGVMLLVSFVLIYLAIKKEYEPPFTHSLECYWQPAFGWSK